jgi:hypothetical protein
MPNCDNTAGNIMKSKHGPKFIQKLKRKDPFEIRSVESRRKKKSQLWFGASSALARHPIEPKLHLPPKHPLDYLKTLVSIATNTWRAKS